jgi:hypothetical protein
MPGLFACQELIVVSGIPRFAALARPLHGVGSFRF